MKNIYTPIIIAFLALFMFFEQAQAHLGESGRTDFDTSVEMDRIVDEEKELPPTIVSATPNHPSACGASDGSIDFIFTNVPEGSYNLDHSSGQLAITVDGAGMGSTAGTLSATTYNNITITTDCGTSMEDIDVTLTNPMPTISIAGKTDPTTCGGSDGSITFSFTNVLDGTYNIGHASGTFLNVSVSGGVATVINLSPGDYSDPNISYNNGTCTASSMDDGVITSPPGPTIQAEGTNPSTCNGTDGRIDFTFTGVPDGDYFLDYNGGSQLFVSVTNNAGSVVGLGTSTYNNIRITVGSCTSTQDPDINLVAPTPPSIDVTGMNNPSTCGGSDGSIQLNLGNIPNGNQSFDILYGANGMIEGSFQVSTSGNNGNTTSPPLPAGAYTDLRFMANGCTSTENPDVTLTDPGAPEPSINQNQTFGPTSCNEDNGQITLSNLEGLTNYDISYEFNGSPVTLDNRISSVDGQLTIMGLAAGAYTNITVTPDGIFTGDCTSAPLQTTLAAPDPPVAGLSSDAPNNTICLGDPVTFTGSGGVEYEFLLNGSSVQNSPSDTYTTTSLLSGDQVSVIVTANNDCTATSTPISTTVNQASPPTGSPSQSFCDDNNPSPTLASIVVNGIEVKWYANPNNTGFLQNTTLLTDNTTYYATQMQNGCESTGNLAVMVTVDEAPNAGTGGTTDMVCNNGETVNLNALITGEDSGGQWADTDGSGVSLANTSAVSFSGVQPGSYTFTYTVTGVGACSNLSPSSTTTVVVTDALISSSASANNPIICSTSSELINLNGTVESGSGLLTGTWSGGQGSFGNVNVGNTTYTRGANEFGPVTLRWSIFDPCENETVMHEVDIQINAGITEVEAGASQSTCGTQSTDPLGASVSLDNGQLGTGMWSGGQGSFSSPTNPNATYMPSPTEIGSDVILTWTADDPDGNGPCQGGESDNVVISVTDVVTGATAMTSTPTICSDEIATVIGGATSPDGTAVSSGMWSGGSGIFANANDPETTYTPGSNEFNSVTLTWTVTDACTGATFSANTQIQVNAGVQSVSTGQNQDVCGIMATAPLGGNVTLDNNQQGDGTWSGGQGNFSSTSNPNATYTPTNNEIGTTVTLTWTASDPDGNGPCTGGQSSTVQVTVSDIVTAVNASTNDDNICSNGSTNIVGSATLQGGGSSNTGQWVGGNGNFQPSRTSASATYTPGSGEAGTTVSLTWRVTDPCTEETLNSIPIQIAVNPAIENVTASANNPTVCSDQTVNLTASVTLENDASSSGTWTTAGTGTFGNPNNGNTTYTLGNNEVAGSVTLTWTANDPDGNGPCTGGDFVNVDVDISPAVTAVTASGPTAICSTGEAELSASVTLANGLASNGFWTGGGNDVIPNGNGFIYDPLASEAGDDIVLTWRAADPDGNGPCTGSELFDDVPMSINDGIESINLNGPQATCFDVPVMLSASVSRTSGNSLPDGLWSSSSGINSAFDPINENQTTYTPIGSDEGNIIALTWTTIDPDGNGPCPNASANLNLLVNALPTAPTAINTGDDAICAGDNTPTLDVSVNASESVNWFNTPTGGNPISGGIGTPNFIPPAEGSYFAQTISAAGCNSASRTELEFIVYDLPTAGYGRSGFPFVNTTNTFTDESTSTDGTIINWLWSFGEDADPSTSTEQGPVQVLWTSSGDKTISLKVTDTNNCMEQIVSPPLNISNTGCAINISTTMGGPNVSGCVGDQINFVVASQQTSGTALEWETSSVNWQVIEGNANNVTIIPQTANLNGLTFANMVFNAPGSYSIRMTAQDIQPPGSSEPPCVAMSDIVNVTINQLPNGTITAIDDDICEGTQGEIRFDLEGTQNGGTYNITYTGGAQNNYSSGAVISVPVMTGNNLFELQSVTENATGCTNSDVVSLDNILVHENPEISVVSNCTTSDSYELTVTITDGTAPYDVNINGVFAGSTSIDTFQSNALPDNGNNYSVEVTDDNTCSSDTEMGLENCNCLTEAGDIQMAPVSVCVGETVTVNPSIGFEPDPDDVLNYKVEDENGMDITLQASNTFEYDNNLFIPGVIYTIFPVAGNETAPESGIVDVLNDPCLSIGAGVTVVWHDLPQATIELNDNDNTICPGGDLSFIITLTQGTLPQYDIIITDDVGTEILNLDNVELHLDEAEEYVIPTAILPTVPTTYTISSIGYNGATTCEQTNVASIIVEMFDPPMINSIETNDDLSALSPITFFPDTTLGSSDTITEYMWEFTNPMPQPIGSLNEFEATVQYATQSPDADITLTITDGNGCMDTLTTSVDIELSAECPDGIFIDNEDGNICIGEALDVEALDIDGNFTFNWSFGAGNNSTIANNELQNPNPFTYSNPGTKDIRLTITGQGLQNCVIDTTIEVLATPIPDLRQIDTFSICNNQEVRYIADIGTTTVPHRYDWTLAQDNQPLVTETTDFPTINVSWGESGTLSVLVTNLDTGCPSPPSEDDMDKITVPLPDASSTAIDISEMELIRITRESNNPTNDVVFAYPEKDLCYRWYRATEEEVEDGISSAAAEQNREEGQYFVATDFNLEEDVVWVEVWSRNSDDTCEDNPVCTNNVFSETEIPTIGVIQLAAPPAEPGLALELYPNPNNGNFQLALKGDQVGRFRLNIFDNIGRLLKQEVLDKEVPRNMIESIQLDHLNNGIYFLQVVDEQGESNVIRFVVQQQY